ncbi:sensor histidine kinase [Pedobacter insulae]|uniref:Histidine kinase n=1 Tax=Pedobacter insulae TaxID=414048 RepID=A0A1I2YW33_9SPHI|nr:sensor histidine kinase [Pedobacter insulae]SFH29834.1 Histidine kinase [Pedobacter insulae]
MKSKGAVIVNLLFWLFILALIVLRILNSSIKATWFELWVTFGYYGIINVSLFYINSLILIPDIIKKRQKSWLYLFLIFGLVAVAVVIKTGIAVLYPDIVLQYTDRAGKLQYTEYSHYIGQTFFTSGFFVVTSSLLKFATDWFSNERVQRNLESQKKDMELQFLKSQLNPHFLFNSLNNIYSLAYQKSDKTADAILKLSEIMRYMIYESNDSWVALSKEVEYVQSYIELQKLRFKDGAAVELTLNGEIDAQHIVPLILISFVENAFKHGVANDPQDPIRINIIANQKILHFSITNKKSKTNKDAMGGVGLNNVERRLQLLYPDRYKLNIVNSATHYTSELMLDI